MNATFKMADIQKLHTKRDFRILCRIHRRASQPPGQPPRASTECSVASATRHLPWIADCLSHQYTEKLQLLSRRTHIETISTGVSPYKKKPAPQGWRDGSEVATERWLRICDIAIGVDLPLKPHPGIGIQDFTRHTFIRDSKTSNL